MAAASILLFVHAPLMIGIFAAVQGLINVYYIMAMSGTTLKPADTASGYATAILAPVVAMLLMAPAYITAAVGMFLRAVFSRDDLSSTAQSTYTKTIG